MDKKSDTDNKSDSLHIEPEAPAQRHLTTDDYQRHLIQEVEEQLKEDEEFQQQVLEEDKKLREYWSNYIQAFIAPFKTNQLLKNFISNTAVTGAFAEALIRSIIQSMLPHYRISTGAIISPHNYIYPEQSKDLRTIPQCDLIIWDPSFLPAVFTLGDFALVPCQSARGVIEVKRTTTTIPELKENLKEWQYYLYSGRSDWDKGVYSNYRSNVLGVVVQNTKPLFEGEISPNWLDNKRETPALIRLFDKNHAPDENEILALVFFISQIARQPQKHQLQKLKIIEGALKSKIARLEKHVYGHRE